VLKFSRPTQLRFEDRTLKLVNARAAEAVIGIHVKARKPNSQGAMNR
jgi:hypothetical protein